MVFPGYKIGAYLNLRISLQGVCIVKNIFAITLEIKDCVELFASISIFSKNYSVKEDRGIRIPQHIWGKYKLKANTFIINGDK